MMDMALPQQNDFAKSAHKFWESFQKKLEINS